MQWLHFLAASLQPLPTATLTEGVPSTEPLTLANIIIGYGPIGIVAIILAWALYRGTFTRSADVSAAIDRARADLAAENTRIIAEKNAEIARLIAERDKAQGQYESAIRLIQDQMFPLLSQFTSATNSLLPVMQQVISRSQESHGRDPGGRR